MACTECVLPSLYNFPVHVLHAPSIREFMQLDTCRDLQLEIGREFMQLETCAYGAGGQLL